jgi:hypothetical protein
METHQACDAARETGRRAMKLGAMLTSYDDPDCAQLIVECQRIGVPVTSTLR